MGDSWSLISELESAISGGSAEKRTEILRRVTALFLDDADRLNERQIGVFDDVLVHLVGRIEAKALVQLSGSLGNVTNAPVETVRRLAYDERIAVAAPVLAQSVRLAERDLVEIAKSRSDDHLFAISSRRHVSEAVTDVLVNRGSARVTHRLAENAGARFSRAGYATLMTKAERDMTLAERLGHRLDLPVQLLKQLLAQATEFVRSRLLANAPHEKRGEIEALLAEIASEVRRETITSYDFTSTDDLVGRLNREGKLNERLLQEFVEARRHEETVSTLALFCGAPARTIDRLMGSQNFEGLLVACKAAKLSWTTVRAILQTRFVHYAASESELEEARRAFLVLSQASAQRTLRFVLVQDAAREAG